MQALQAFLPVSVSNMVDAPPPPNARRWVHFVFGSAAFDCGAMIIYQFLTKNYWSCAGSALLLVPLAIGYYHTGASNKTIEQLRREYSNTTKNLQEVVPKVKEAITVAHQALSGTKDNLEDLTKALCLLSTAIEQLPVRLNEPGELHANLDRSLLVQKELANALSQV